MKASRSGSLIFWIVFFSMCFVSIFALIGFFKAAEGTTSHALSESRALAQLQQLTDSLKAQDSVESAKRSYKSFELGSGLSVESAEMETAKNAFAPVLAHFASKQKESEGKFLLTKKRDLMEGLVNAYRKEISSSDIQLRAAYLNILFDIQASLLNESDETELAFVKRNRERFTNLKSIIATSGDSARSLRVSSLESIFSAYEKGFTAGFEWRNKKLELVNGLEKSLSSLAKQIKAGESQAVSDTRRSFFYTAIISLFVMLAGFIVLLIGQKVSRLRFESLVDAMLIVIKEYGQDSAHDQRALTILQGNADWSRLLSKILVAESAFQSSFNSLLAVPKSMKLPYLVFNKEQCLVHGNDGARRFFEYNEGKTSFQELVATTAIDTRIGNKAQLVDNILKSFDSTKQDSFEVIMSESGQWIPMEYLFFPITNGSLAGGKILIIRLIPNEAARIEKSVSDQVVKIREYVQRLAKALPVEIQVNEQDILPVRETILDLQNLKMHVDEREALWKSEVFALDDQVARQREILGRLFNEIQTMNEDYSQLISLIKIIRGSDQTWNKEVSSIEGDLTKWMESRQRLSSDLASHSNILNRAREIELQIRSMASGMKSAISSFDIELSELKNFNQEVKVHAVNLSFTDDPKQKEFAARARAFSQNVSHYTEVVSGIMKNLNQFIGQHPGGSLFPSLDSAEISPLIVENLKEEQMRWSNFLQRWKMSSQEVLVREEQAIDLLIEVDKKNNVAMQLSQTSIVINDQAKQNLGRWH